MSVAGGWSEIVALSSLGGYPADASLMEKRPWRLTLQLRVSGDLISLHSLTPSTPTRFGMPRRGIVDLDVSPCGKLQYTTHQRVGTAALALERTLGTDSRDALGVTQSRGTR